MTKNTAQGRAEGADANDQQFGQGANPQPTKAPFETRHSSPREYATSGMEKALGQHADKVHPQKRR